MLLNRHNLEIAKYADSKSPYTIKGVNVSPEGTTVTNRHYLIRVSLPEQPEAATFKPWTMAAPDAMKIVKAIQRVKKNDDPPTVTLENPAEPSDVTAVTCSVADVAIGAATLPGNFPNCESVFPQEPPTLTIGLSAEYLARLAASAMETCGKDACIKLEFTAHNKVVKMTATNTSTEQTWTALLMPVRLGGKQYTPQPAAGEKRK